MAKNLDQSRVKNFSNWFYGVVLIGLAPVIVRSIFFFIINHNGQFEIFNSADFLGISLSLQIANLIEIKNTKNFINNEVWQLKNKMIIALSIGVISILIFLCLFKEFDPFHIINQDRLSYTTYLSFFSIFIFSIYLIFQLEIINKHDPD